MVGGGNGGSPVRVSTVTTLSYGKRRDSRQTCRGVYCGNLTVT